MARPRVDLVAGARPNFMKLAPVLRALREEGRVDACVVHTGQHYDRSMSAVFFEELDIPEPDVHLDVGSGTHGVQTARILERYEARLLAEPPAAVVVFGDVNSTVASALAAVKLGVRVAHVEAGLRSGDRSMPEETNRILTDAMADLLLVSEASGVENLRREGIEEAKIRLVGNVMIDTLLTQLKRARSSNVLARLQLEQRGYGLVTLHRPSNVDDPRILSRILQVLGELSQQLPLVFPIHPRTRTAIERAGLSSLLHPERSTLRALEPLPYTDNLALMSGAAVVLTDSGGMQEETAVLRVPCLTMRPNTERPVTVRLGTSRLVANDPERIRQGFQDVLDGNWTKGAPIPLWDGRASERIAAELGEWLGA